ncbi:MAG: LysE family translocator [Alphaproteobacteria bacterium]|nr:LysE family translocator [Alphaproteobacteria bacterium]
MEITVWFALLLLFLSGGLTPGPAVMLVTTSSMRYGFWPAMAPALGVCAANLIWILLAAFGVSALAHAFPAGFLALKVAGIAYICWLAWRMAFHGTVDLARREPPPRAHQFARGVGLQLANPNALVFFGGLLPAYIAPDHSLPVQCAIIVATLTATELFGLVTYAAAAEWLARRFASPSFAHAFYRLAALAMAGSAVFAVYVTWASTGG